MMQQIHVFLLLFGALQGIMLSLWFFRNRKRELASFYMGLFLFVVGLQLTLKSISKVWMMDQVVYLYILSFYLPFLIGPLLYLLSEARKGKHFQWVDLCHLLPFILSLPIGWIAEAMPGSNIHLPVYVTASLQTLSLGTYAYFAVKQSSTPQKSFVLLAAAAEWVIILTMAVMYYQQLSDIRLLFILLTLLIYYTSYQVISRSSPFEESNTQVASQAQGPVAKYAHSGLKAEEADRIEKVLKQVMEQEKLFLDSSLTIDILSVRVSTSRHYLSQVLNTRFQKTFTDYLNELRVQEVCKRLSDPVNHKYTIASIAFDCGFNSIATFNEVFKKHRQTTPSKFRQLLLK